MTSPTASEYVLLSAQSYYYYRKEGIRRSSAGGGVSIDGQQSLTTDQIPGLAGWTVDLANSYTDPVSGFSATIFEKNGQYVVAFELR